MRHIILFCVTGVFTSLGLPVVCRDVRGAIAWCTCDTGCEAPTHLFAPALQATKAAARAAAAAAQRTAPRTRTAPPQRPRWWRPTGATRWKTLPRWPPPPPPCQPCWPCQPWHSTTDNGDNAGGNRLNVDSRVIAPFFLFFFLFFVFNRLKAAVKQTAFRLPGPGAKRSPLQNREQSCIVTFPLSQRWCSAMALTSSAAASLHPRRGGELKFTPMPSRRTLPAEASCT